MKPGPSNRTVDPNETGLNFVVMEPHGGPKLATRRIQSVSLQNVSVAQALEAICKATKTKYEVAGFAVEISAAGPAGEKPQEKKQGGTR